MKRLLLNIVKFLFLIILGISLFHTTALADSGPCTLSPKPINDHQTDNGPIAFTIDPHSGIGANQSYDIWVGNGCNQTRGGAYCFFSQKGINYTGGTLSFSVNKWTNSSNFGAGVTQPVKLYHAGDTQNPVCSMDLNVVAASSWGSCNPLNFSPANPTSSDNIVITPSNIASGQNGTGYGPDDVHHIVVFKGDKNTTYKEAGGSCSGSGSVTGKDLAKGLSLGTFDQSDKGYIVTINNCQTFPVVGHQYEWEQCEQTITVNPKGGGVVTQGDSCTTTGPSDKVGTCSPGSLCMGSGMTTGAISNGVCIGGLGGDGFTNGVYLACSPNCDVNGDVLPSNVCPGGQCGTAIGSINTSPEGFVKSLIGVILSIVGGIAVLLIIISGYRLMISQGNPENIKNAKDQLTAAIIGLLFVIFSLVILQVIGYDILGLPGFKP